MHKIFVSTLGNLSHKLGSNITNAAGRFHDISHSSAASLVNIIQEVLNLFVTFILIPDKGCTQKQTDELFTIVVLLF
jgi:uncharacterized membrane protein YhaH (DUF805 family)